MRQQSNVAHILEGLVVVQQTFVGAGLTEPPIPRRFERRVRMCGPFCFATRPVDPMAMYFFEHYVMEALTASPRDYVAISHAGHGVNSYAINYHLVDGPLALFAQVGWGGGYHDAAETSQQVDDLFRRLSRIIAAADAARTRGLARHRGRLVVIESRFREKSAWGWLDRPLRRRAAKGWLEARSVLAEIGDDARPKASPIDEATDWLAAAG
jgi:hypothetical protein